MKNFKEKLSGLLFLEIIPEKASKLFSTSIEDEIYVPINPNFLVKRVSSGDDLSKIPITEFIIGMAYTLGADPEFKYAPIYRQVLNNFKDADKLVKGKIAQLLKEDRKEEALIVLLGLNEARKEEEIENVLLSLGEELSLKNPELKDNVLLMADNAIEKGNKNGYLIKGSILYTLKRNNEALISLREYLKEGGEKSKDLLLLMNELERSEALKEAYTNVHENPEEALKTLLKYQKEEGNNPTLLYNIAKANRELKNYEKAIYYLNEALALDSGYLDVLNELGVNFGMLEDYENARMYFKKVYETTKELAPLTNLIIATYNAGDKEEAAYLLRKAEVMAPEDEIVQTIARTYNI